VQPWLCLGFFQSILASRTLRRSYQDLSENIPVVRGSECQYKRWVNYKESQRGHHWKPLSSWRWAQKAALLDIGYCCTGLDSPRLSLPARSHKILYLSSERFSISRGCHPTSATLWFRRVVMTVIGVMLQRLMEVKVRNMPRSSDQWITWTHIHRSTWYCTLEGNINGNWKIGYVCRN